MTNRELLERASKAAGVELTWWEGSPRDTTGFHPTQNIYNAPIWNPLDDAACLERFAALVAAAEREACAKVCEDEAEKQFDNMDIPLTIAADLIRARGTQ